MPFYAESRWQIVPIFFVQCNNPNCATNEQYSREEVFAEASNGAGVGGAVIGGLIGLLGGPLGLIIGAVIGGAAGAEADKSEEEKIKRFNTGL